MTTDAAGTQVATEDSAAAAPMLSPTEAELWEDAIPQGEAMDEGDDGDEPSGPPAEEAGDEGPQDDEQTEGDEDEEAGEDDSPDDRTPPQADVSRAARDAEAFYNVAANPAAIRDYPAKQRKYIRAGAEAAKAAGLAIARQMAPQHQQQATQIERQLNELEELLETDATVFKRALRRADPVVVQAWYNRVQQQADDEEDDADRRARGSASSPPQQQPGGVPPEQRAIQQACAEEVQFVLDQYGEAAHAELIEWIRNEGLVASREDLRAIKQRVLQLAQGGEGPPVSTSRNEKVVAKRKKLPKADVSPGGAVSSGKADPVAMGEMSESELWALVE